MIGISLHSSFHLCLSQNYHCGLAEIYVIWCHADKYVVLCTGVCLRVCVWQSLDSAACFSKPQRGTRGLSLQICLTEQGSVTVNWTWVCLNSKTLLVVWTTQIPVSILALKAIIPEILNAIFSFCGSVLGCVAGLDCVIYIPLELLECRRWCSLATCFISWWCKDATIKIPQEWTVLCCRHTGIILKKGLFPSAPVAIWFSLFFDSLSLSLSMEPGSLGTLHSQNLSQEFQKERVNFCLSETFEQVRLVLFPFSKNNRIQPSAV